MKSLSVKLGVIIFMIFVMAFVLGYCRSSQADSNLVAGDIRSPEKKISLVDNYVFIEGRWKRTDGTSKLIRMANINTVSITCDKIERTCRETIAQLVTLKEAQWMEKPLLYIDTTTYHIIDWSDHTIYAKHPAPVADFELRISIKDKFAERRRRETKTRGAETSDPNIFENWVLE